MKYLFTTLITISAFNLFSQSNVGIGTTSPNSKAVLDVESDDKGVLISRLTTSARNTLGTSLTNTEDGMLVYDKDLTAFYYWDGPNLQWVQVGSGNGDNWGADVVNINGTNISGNGTSTNPIIVTEVDGDITNEIQDLSINSTTNILTITNNNSPTNIDLSSYLDNTDSQTLSLSGNSLTISNGNTITLIDNVNDADADPNNEIELPTGGTNGQLLSTDGNGNYTWVSDNNGTDTQDLSLTGNSLSLTNDGTPVDLSGYLDNTDSQNLTNTVTGGNATINISGGTGTTFSINDADADPTNEYNTGANLTGNNFNIIDGGGTQTVDLSGLKDHDWYEVGGTTQPDNIADNIFTQGNVGIGINNPISPLHTSGGPIMTNGYNRTAVFHAVHPVIQFKGISNTNNSGFIGYDAQASVEAMRFWTGAATDDNGGTSAAKMSILATGDIGIATTTPTAKLDINGDLRVRNIPSGTSTDEILVANANGDVRKLPLKMTDTWQVIGTTSIGTTTKAWVDMPNMLLNINLVKQADVSISWDATLFTGGSGLPWGAFRILVDGTPVNWGHIQAYASWDQTPNLSYIAQNLTAGNHVIKVQWAVGSSGSGDSINNAAASNTYLGGTNIWSRQLRAIAFYY